MKKYKIPNQCSVCGSVDSVIKEIECNECCSTLSGNFKSCEFCDLDEDEYNFIIVFIKSHGNIKEVEKKLGISYPTVKNKLGKVIKKLENKESQEDKMRKMKKKILDDLENGIISPKEAIDLLK